MNAKIETYLSRSDFQFERVTVERTWTSQTNRSLIIQEIVISKSILNISTEKKKELLYILESISEDC